jgi:diguanylate cyclase (GGDEF)-like protein/PAS domain S-box-containing protein
MGVLRKWLNAIGLGGEGTARPTNLAGTPLADLPVPVIFLDRDGRVLAANPAADWLAATVGEGRVPALGALVAQALSASRAFVETVSAASQAGPRLYEALVIPASADEAMVLAKDVTLESNLRASLLESRQRYKDLVEISSDFAWEVGTDGRFVFVSPRGALGYMAEQLVGSSPADFVIEQPGLDGLLAFRAEHPVEEAELWMRRADGRLACLLASGSPLRDGQGRRIGARGVCRDITRDREREAALARANNRERLLNHIVRTIREVVDPADIPATAAESTARALAAEGCQIFRQHELAADPSGMVLAAQFGQTGDGFAELGKFGEDDLYLATNDGLSLLGVRTRHRGNVNGTILLWRHGGDLPWGEDERLLIEEVANQLGSAVEQIANHERIVMLSRTDSLTGLFNRRAFFEELSRRFSRLSRDRKLAALIYIDLDNFKQVNDRYGHQRGDEALIAVRDILLRHSRPADLVARLGGDEFAMWMEGTDEATTKRRCEAILEAAAALKQFSGSPDQPLSLSLGVAVHVPDRPETFHDLMARADAAMYAVKHAGKDSYRVAAPAVTTKLSAR